MCLCYSGICRMNSVCYPIKVQLCQYPSVQVAWKCAQLLQETKCHWWRILLLEITLLVMVELSTIRDHWSVTLLFGMFCAVTFCRSTFPKLLSWHLIWCHTCVYCCDVFDLFDVFSVSMLNVLLKLIQFCCIYCW